MDEALRFHLQTRLSIDELGLLWRDLESRADITFFLSWHWIGAWLAVLGRPPVVLIGETGGRLVLLGIVMPRRRVEAGIVRMYGAYLHATGQRELDVIAHEYNGFVVDRGWIGRAERAASAFLLGGLSIAGHRIDELHIVAVPEPEHARLLPPSTLVQVPARKPSFRVDLDAIRQTGQDYLDTLGANTRQQIRRSMRLYAERGTLSAERAPDLATALSYLADLKELHQAQWQERGEPGGFAFPFFESFLRRLVTDTSSRTGPSETAHAGVELVRVRAGDTGIGYLFNLIFRGHVMAFVSGFRFEADPRLKPGLVSHALCIENHLAGGAHLYDFLAGASRYKANLGQPGPDFVYLLLQRRTAMALAERELRRVWDGVRRLRRP